MEGSSKIDLGKYLSRIGVAPGSVGADIESLRHLQTQHLRTIPFENLDIHWRRPIIVDTERFFDKIVNAGRGGFCYELNGLFNELLVGLGFDTRIVSARVALPSGYGPDFDHAAILVNIGGQRYIADVGFGDFIAEPLRFVTDIEQTDPAGIFVIRVSENDYLEVSKRDGEEWKSEYIFKDESRDLTEFAAMCDFQQYSPDSHFIRGKVCSLMTAAGRKTLTDTKFIETAGGERAETPVASEEKFNEILLMEFGIASPSERPV